MLTRLTRDAQDGDTLHSRRNSDKMLHGPVGGDYAETRAKDE